MHTSRPLQTSGDIDFFAESWPNRTADRRTVIVVVPAPEGWVASAVAGRAREWKPAGR